MFNDILDEMLHKAAEALQVDVQDVSADTIAWGLYIDHKTVAPTQVRQSFMRTYRTRDDHVTVGFDAATGDIYC